MISNLFKHPFSCPNYPKFIFLFEFVFQWILPRILDSFQRNLEKIFNQILKVWVYEKSKETFFRLFQSLPAQRLKLNQRFSIVSAARRSFFFKNKIQIQINFLCKSLVQKNLPANFFFLIPQSQSFESLKSKLNNLSQLRYCLNSYFLASNKILMKRRKRSSSQSTIIFENAKARKIHESASFLLKSTDL